MVSREKSRGTKTEFKYLPITEYSCLGRVYLMLPIRDAPRIFLGGRVAWNWKLRWLTCNGSMCMTACGCRLVARRTAVHLVGPCHSVSSQTGKLRMSLSSSVSISLQIFVSSANKWMLGCTLSGTSFIYAAKSTGPRILNIRMRRL